MGADRLHRKRGNVHGCECISLRTQARHRPGGPGPAPSYHIIWPGSSTVRGPGPRRLPKEPCPPLRPCRSTLAAPLTRPPRDPPEIAPSPPSPRSPPALSFAPASIIRPPPSLGRGATAASRNRPSSGASAPVALLAPLAPVTMMALTLGSLWAFLSSSASVLSTAHEQGDEEGGSRSSLSTSPPRLPRPRSAFRAEGRRDRDQLERAQAIPLHSRTRRAQRVEGRVGERQDRDAILDAARGTSRRHGEGLANTQRARTGNADGARKTSASKQTRTTSGSHRLICKPPTPRPVGAW